MDGMNIVDRVVGFFDPRAGLRRWHARHVLARATGYEAANPGRLGKVVRLSLIHI